MAGKTVTGGPITRKPPSEKPDDPDALPVARPIGRHHSTRPRSGPWRTPGQRIDVTEYADEVELFEKMGIKVGEAKTKA